MLLEEEFVVVGAATARTARPGPAAAGAVVSGAAVGSLRGVLVGNEDHSVGLGLRSWGENRCVIDLHHGNLVQ